MRGPPDWGLSEGTPSVKWFYEDSWHDISDTIAQAAPPTPVTLDVGELRFCGGTWYANITTMGDVTLSGEEGAVINGGGSAPVVTVASAGAITVRDVTLTGGASYDGGGVYCRVEGPTLSLSNLHVTGNTASHYGGGVYIEGCNTTMEGGSVTDNTSNFGAGGLFVGGDFATSATLRDVSVDGNSTGGDVGGIHVAGAASSLSLIDTILTNNTATGYSGGLGLGDAVATCTATTAGAAGFRGNIGGLGKTSVGWGGAVYLQLVNVSPSFTSDNCDFGEEGTADDNGPEDVRIYGGASYDYGDAASFVCTSTGCI